MEGQGIWNKTNGEGKHRAQFSGPKSCWVENQTLLEVRKGKECFSISRLCRTGSDLGFMLENRCRNTVYSINKLIHMNFEWIQSQDFLTHQSAVPACLLQCYSMLLFGMRRKNLDGINFANGWLLKSTVKCSS